MKFNSNVIFHAKVLWDFLISVKTPGKSEIIVLCCSYDLRVCDYACELIKRGDSERILFTGNTGNWTNKLWKQKEAEAFNDRALKNGINQKDITLETKARNIGENIEFARNLLADVKTVTFVTKPNTLLRVKLSKDIKWESVHAFYDCPDFKFPEQASNVVGVFGLINEMVGDIDRIIEYPRLGFQSSIDCPDDVLQSWRHLIDDGFTEHLIES